MRMLAGFLLALWLIAGLVLTLEPAHPLAGQVVDDNLVPFHTLSIYLANLGSWFWMRNLLGNLEPRGPELRSSYEDVELDLMAPRAGKSTGIEVVTRATTCPAEASDSRTTLNANVDPLRYIPATATYMSAVPTHPSRADGSSQALSIHPAARSPASTGFRSREREISSCLPQPGIPSRAARSPP